MECSYRASRGLSSSCQATTRLLHNTTAVQTSETKRGRVESTAQRYLCDNGVYVRAVSSTTRQRQATRSGQTLLPHELLREMVLRLLQSTGTTQPKGSSAFSCCKPVSASYSSNATFPSTQVVMLVQEFPSSPWSPSSLYCFCCAKLLLSIVL